MNNPSHNQEGLDASPTGAPNPLVLADFLLHRIATLEEANSALEDELEKVERLAYFDPLTGLENRNGLDRYIGNLGIRLSQRVEDGECLEDEFVGVVAIDANRLKTTNDTLGHEAGDKLLEHLSDVLIGITRHDSKQAFEERRQLEENDSFPDGVFRLGGDEFLLVLYGLKKANLPNLEEGLRELEFMKVRFEESDIDFSASYDTRVVPCDEVVADSEVLLLAISEADKSMMKIKASQKRADQ